LPQSNATVPYVSVRTLNFDRVIDGPTRMKESGMSRSYNRSFTRSVGLAGSHSGGGSRLPSRSSCVVVHHGRDRPLAIRRRRQRRHRAGTEIERLGRGQDHRRFSPHQTPFRGSERTLGEHHVEPPRIELFDQLRADADLHLELERSDRVPKAASPRATSSTTQRRTVLDRRGAAKRCRAAFSNCSRGRASPRNISCHPSA
jgi:hypothetical protein